MRTIPRHYSGSARGDYRVTCGICGVLWLRSVMERKPDGRLHCPDCQPEVDVVTLTREQEQNTVAIDLQPWRER